MSHDHDMDEEDQFNHSQDNDDYSHGLGAGVEDGDLDTNRQMRMERKGKYAAIGRNLVYPVRKLKDVFHFAVKHPFKAAGIYAGTTAAGTTLSVLGARAIGQQVNIENVVSMGATSMITVPLAVGAANVGLYAWQRATDMLAGADYVISHKRVSKAGTITGLALAGCMTFFGGNMYGDNFLKTYASPVLDPLNTGAHVLAFIPDQVMRIVAPSSEGTYADAWVTKPEQAACEVRAQNHETFFGLPCRAKYYDGSKYTLFSGYLNDKSNTDHLRPLWDGVMSGLKKMGVVSQADAPKVNKTASLGPVALPQRAL